MDSMLAIFGRAALGMRGWGNKRGGGLLDFPQKAKIGAEIRIPSPVAQVAGSTVSIQRLNVINTFAEVQANPDGIVLTMSAIPLPAITTPAPPQVADQLLLQGRLRFGIGLSQFGFTNQTTAAAFPSDIIFDLNQGVAVTIGASGFLALDLLYTGVRLSAPFAPADLIGPEYLVEAGLSYGSTKSVQCTKTDAIQNIGIAGNITIPKPNFAQSFTPLWTEYAGAAAMGPIFIRFSGGAAVNLGCVQIPVPAPVVPPTFLWPPNARTMQVFNLGAGPITNFYCVHNLYL